MSPVVPIIILILAIPIYFICFWGMKNMKAGTVNNRKWLALIPTIIISPVIYLGLTMIWIFSNTYYTSIEFDRTKWNSNIEERYRMSEEIIDSKMLIGKTQKEVIEILGTNYSSYNGSRITYELGFVPGPFNIDPSYLEITFEKGFVVNVNKYEG